jgi:anaerobic C4-dicarboxylate transporter
MLLCALSIPACCRSACTGCCKAAGLSAAVDMALVLVFAAVIVHVWRTGRYQIASLGVTIFYSAGMLATVYLRGVRWCTGCTRP